MPIYEYRCKDCKKVFEELVSTFADADTKFKCPSCASTSTERKLSVIGGIGRSTKNLPSCGASCPSAGACGGGSACSQFS